MYGALVGHVREVEDRGKACVCAGWGMCLWRLRRLRLETWHVYVHYEVETQTDERYILMMYADVC